ncbi:uricase-like [Dendrobium catenatum]|uniref:uricase-like n=1 Tax=Dendrobium catenatum TaxID=906689 RepID=UPI0010A03B1A|nr:uricase-like [Dendrobium catenatum]
MPIFEGDDAHGWIYKVERHFAAKGLTKDERLTAAGLCLERKGMRLLQSIFRPDTKGLVVEYLDRFKYFTSRLDHLSQTVLERNFMKGLKPEIRVTIKCRFQFESISAIPTESKFFIERYRDVKKVIVDTFFGPPTSGVYSPSVQNTLYLMAVAVLNRFPDIASIQLRMPNIHFLPVNLSSKDNPNLVKFADDVYLPTDEPHGTIEATLSRPPLSKL